MNHLGALTDGRHSLGRGPGRDGPGPGGPAPGGRRALNWRRDFTVPVVILALQVAGALGARHHHPPGQLDVLGWLLLAAGPLALTVRRRHPVAVLGTTLAVTLPPAASPAANLSLVVAFFGAAVSGHRRAAWAAIVAGYATAVWLEPLVFGRAVGSMTFALLLGAWLLGLVIAAEAVRLRRGRAAGGGGAR